MNKETKSLYKDQLYITQSNMQIILFNILIFISYNVVSVENDFLPDFESNLL